MTRDSDKIVFLARANFDDTIWDEHLSYQTLAFSIKYFVYLKCKNTFFIVKEVSDKCHPMERDYRHPRSSAIQNSQILCYFSLHSKIDQVLRKNVIGFVKLTDSINNKKNITYH